MRRPFSLAGLSTGLKMLLILTVALLPLGLIALLASIQSAHTKRIQREGDARIVASAEARQVDILVLRGANVLRAALAIKPFNAADCVARFNAEQRAFGANVQFALLDLRGRVKCASRGFVPNRHFPVPRYRIGADVQLLAEPPGIRFTLAGPNGGYGVGVLPISLVSRMLPTHDGQGIVLTQGDTSIRLSTPARAQPLGQHLTVTAPIGGGQANLAVTIVANPITAVEILLVLLPLLMWAAAAVIGWVVIDQLVLRPLAQLQRAVVGYRPGDGMLALPRFTTPSQEIRALGETFQATAQQLVLREAELEEGLSRQVRLTREVHHRVKNNLQVVASLINLHSRGTSGEVAKAYASIQRRVDALAVVHRNHYAELEENRGVALRSIIAELTANLRGTAPPAASRMTITLDMAPAFITQDVAVPVAFLVTEIVELAMARDGGGSVAVTLTPDDAPDRALLSITAPGLAEARGDDPNRDRFERIVLGLSRQLRSHLDYDAEAGRYDILITTLPPEAAAEK